MPTHDRAVHAGIVRGAGMAGDDESEGEVMDEKQPEYCVYCGRKLPTNNGCYYCDVCRSTTPPMKPKPEKLSIFKIWPYDGADFRWFAGKDIDDAIAVYQKWYEEWSSGSSRGHTPHRIEKAGELENEYNGEALGGD